jgi:uncharacterized membrane protein YphA (DoxX/SURF4 family)
MKTPSLHIVRVGLGITFLWIGILIFKEPLAWGGYLQPWATELLPVPLAQIMIGIALLDSIIGILFLIDTYTWIAALVAGIHILIILIVSGVTDITVRDIGILTAIITLLSETFPEKIKQSLMPFPKKPPPHPPYPHNT